VPAELHANRMQWLIRLSVIRYVSVMWRPGVHRSVNLLVIYKLGIRSSFVI
jgi:hypothetical protein